MSRLPDSNLQQPVTQWQEAHHSTPASKESLREGVVWSVNEKRQTSGEKDSRLLDEFRNCSDWREKLRLWFGAEFLKKWVKDWDSIIRFLDQDIARLDLLLSEQLERVIQHPQFQRLEAGWMGMNHLVNCKEDNAGKYISVRILSARWGELKSDLEGAIEFDQSNLFRKIYEEGIGTPGANPFSALLMNYDIHPTPSKLHPFDDIWMVEKFSEIAACAFAPMFFNASPAMFGVDEFAELQNGSNVELLHSSPAFARWNRFRSTADARFVSLMLPRILMRKPYRPEYLNEFGFRFEESTKGRNSHLWGGAIWGMGEILIRNFAQSGWFTEIRGMERGLDVGGVVRGPAQESFISEPGRVASKPIVDVVITDAMDRVFAKQGFMSLCASKYSPEAVLYSCPSAQKPKKFDSREANANAELSILTNYILCASRVTHFIKIIARDMIGSVKDANEIQGRLQDWILNYVNRDPHANRDMRMERPLLDGLVQVIPTVGRPGEYNCSISLEPFHTFEDVRVALRLDTKLVNPVTS